MTKTKEMPPVAPDEVTVIYSKNEILTLANILIFSKQVFAEMSANFLKEGNNADAETMNARSLLSQHLLSKLQSIDDIGEPESRQIH